VSIVRVGSIMAIYAFIVIVIYIVLSSPFDDIMTDFENLNLTNSDTEVEGGSSYGRLVFDMIFALAVIIPMLWFIIWCFRREPDWGERFR